jgi:hypothetical protein
MAAASPSPHAPALVTSQTGGGDGTSPPTADHTPAGVGILGTPSTLGTSRATTIVAVHFSDLAAQEQVQLIQAAQSRARSGTASPHFKGCPPRELARQLLLIDSTDGFSDLTTQAQLQFIEAAHSRARSSAASPHFNGCPPHELARQLPPNNGPLKFTHTCMMCSTPHPTVQCPQRPGA